MLRFSKPVGMQRLGPSLKNGIVRQTNCYKLNRSEKSYFMLVIFCGF